MSCPVYGSRRAASNDPARRARYNPRKDRLNLLRKKKGPTYEAQRARLRWISRAAGRQGSVLCPGHGQVGCNLPAHICVAICRNKSVPCPGLRHECVVGADLTPDLLEAHNDG